MSRVASWFVAVVLFVASAHAHAQVDAERVRIHGSQTMAARLVPAVAESWLHDIGYQGIRRTQPSPTRSGRVRKACMSLRIGSERTIRSRC